MADDDIEVKYGLKEILARMESAQIAGFTEIKTTMAAKADKADVARIDAHLSRHDKELGDHRQEIGGIKDQMKQDEAAQQAVSQERKTTSSSRQTHINVALSVALVMVSFLGVLAAVLHW